MDGWFYGIRGIRMIWHGEWADPELVWHGESFNYYDLEDDLRGAYQEECEETGVPASDERFAAWVRKNAPLARQYLKLMLDARRRERKAAMTRPILFNTEMVRAILDGRKTTTRRLMNPQPTMDGEGMWHWKDCQWMDGGLGFPESGIEDYAPYQVGNVLWVRETWQHLPDYIDLNSGGYVFKASESGEAWGSTEDWTWRPSIHMPKEAARIFLRVTGVRVERLQDMTEEDAELEGYKGCPFQSADYSTVPPSPCFAGGHCSVPDAWYCNHTLPEQFAREIWDPIYAKRNGGAYAWDANPWVWVFKFGQCEKPAGW